MVRDLYKVKEPFRPCRFKDGIIILKQSKHHNEMKNSKTEIFEGNKNKNRMHKFITFLWIENIWLMDYEKRNRRPHRDQKAIRHIICRINFYLYHGFIKTIWWLSRVAKYFSRELCIFNSDLTHFYNWSSLNPAHPERYDPIDSIQLKYFWIQNIPEKCSDRIKPWIEKYIYLDKWCLV